jgi:hypothetical protein
MAPPVYITLPNKDRSVLSGQFGRSNYVVNLAETLSFPGTWECFLLSASIPYVWNNVTESNNSLVLPGKEVRLTPGNYSSAKILIEAITKLLDGAADPKFSVDESTMRTTIVVTTDHSIGGPLLQLLGFPAGTELKNGTHISPNLIDITGGVHSLLVYISIIEQTNVGSYQAPLLATIPLANAAPGDIIQWTANGPSYEAHKLNTRSFGSIEVDIRSNLGTSLDFQGFDASIRIGIRKTI